MVTHNGSKCQTLIAGIIFATGISWAVQALAQTAPDATGTGPFVTTSAEYKFPAVLDPDISGMPTELWARVYRPTDLSGGPYPLLIFLHGNHATCGRSSNPRIDDNTQYTFYGTCPPGYVVTPNHEGYGYLADRLASWGYIVVSINANRGVNAAPGPSDDLGVNLVRGRLLLRHLQRLSEWNTFGGTPDSLGVELQGKLDFNHVGLLGHSRGGEGVRAAYNFYRDLGSPWPDRIPDPVTFQAIFEIGPVDGQTIRQLNADGVVWNLLLPMCDGDVNNLQGIKPFDRMIQIFTEDPATQKSTFTVWGANHNYYNTEWQQSDSVGCVGPGNNPLFLMPVGSPQQRQTSLASVMALFRGNVGADADPTFNENFNPQFMLPDVVTSVTRVDRGYTDSPNSNVTMVFEDFDRATGTNTYGFPNDASDLSTFSHGSVPNHNAGDPYGRTGVQRAGAISWTASGADTYFQTNWQASGSGRDIGGFQTLDLRASRQCSNTVCQAPSPLNPVGPTDFSIELVMADGTLSQAVLLSSYTDLRGPVGGPGNAGLHPILQTARIPLSDFAGADLTQVRGVRFTFDGTATGAIYLASIRLSTLTGLGADSGGSAPANFASIPDFSQALPTVASRSSANRIVAIRSVASGVALGNQPGVEIQITSDEPFPVRDELAVLSVNGVQTAMSRYPENGDTHTLIFTLTPEQFAQVSTGDPVTVQYGFGESNDRWNLGPLDKGVLNQGN